MLQTYLERVRNTKSLNTYLVYSRILGTLPSPPIAVEQLDGLIRGWKQQGLAPNTIVLNLTVIRNYLNFLNSRSPVENYLELIEITQSVRGEEKIKPIPNRNSIEKLILEKRFAKGTEKYKLVLGFLMYCGMRIQEVLNLKWGDLEGDVVIVRNTKGKRDRKVPIPPPMLLILDEFPQGQPGEKIFNYLVGSVQHFIGRHLGTHPHALRHLYATHLIQKSVPVMMVQSVLGHRNLQTTMRYVHLEQSDINKSIQNIY